MRILALTFGTESAASSLYRVYQYAEPLARLGIRLDIHPADQYERWNSLKEYDAVLIQKKLFRASRLRFIRSQARKLIYDTDDAIWEPHDLPHHWFTRWRTRRRLHRVAAWADGCIAANGVLAAELRRHSGRVEVVPMALDEDLWRPLAERAPSGVRVGWAGAPANRSYLRAMEPALLAVQQRHAEVEFVVYCGQSPGFTGGLKTTHIPFQPGAEPEVVRSFDIGLLPLPDNAFAHGKSPIKGLQYMASGVATVATPLGATTEMFQADRTALFAVQPREWVAALLRLISDVELRRRISREAGAVFQARHARSVVVRDLERVLRLLVAGAPGGMTCQST